MKRKHNIGMGYRLFLSLLIVALTSDVSFAANRAQTYIEGKKKTYYEETGKIEADTQKTREALRRRINAEVLAGIDESCKQGRLDIAEQLYVIKTGMEKGRNFSEKDLAPLADKASSVKEMLQELNREEEKGNQKISEINLKYQNQCQELLRKTKEIDNSEFNDLVAYKQQFNLPFGAVQPRDGKKVGGLDCRIFAGEFNRLSSITTGRELTRTFTPSPGILWGMPKEQFGAIWEGFYYAEKEGLYEFILVADDAARFSLGGQRVVGRYAGQTALTLKGSISLSRGWHPVKLEYLQRKGDAALKIQVRRADSEKTEDIPSSSFSVGRNEAVLSGS